MGVPAGRLRGVQGPPDTEPPGTGHRPGPCSLHSGHGGPCMAPGRPALLGSLLCTTGCEPPLHTPRRETRRPASTPLRSPPGPAPLRASTRDSRGGWAPTCPVEVAKEHPPTRPWAGCLRSWHPADLAEGPSLLQLSPRARHRPSSLLQLSPPCRTQALLTPAAEPPCRTQALPE